jgi:FeS assembly protein IscX
LTTFSLGYNLREGFSTVDEILTWEDSYAIARALMAAHPEVKVETLSLHDIYAWTVALSAFCDEPELSNDAILMAIIREWFEEDNPV